LFGKLERERERKRKKSFPGNSLEVSSWAVDSYGSVSGASERASERTRCRSATAMRVERLGFTASLGQSRRCA
jgi:hypothetical protein